MEDIKQIIESMNDYQEVLKMMKELNKKLGENNE